MKKFLGLLFVLTILLGVGVPLVAVVRPAGSVFAQDIQELGGCKLNDAQCLLNFCGDNLDACTDYANSNNIDPSLFGGQQTGGLLEDCNPVSSLCDTADLICKNGICIAELPAGPQSGGEILRIIEAIGDWIFGAFILVAIIFIILALFDFISGGGDPAKISSARHKLIYAVIGVGLALIAGGIDDVLRNILLPSP